MSQSIYSGSFTTAQFVSVQLCLHWLCYNVAVSRVNAKQDNVVINIFFVPNAVSLSSWTQAQASAHEHLCCEPLHQHRCASVMPL